LCYGVVALWRFTLLMPTLNAGRFARLAPFYLLPFYDMIGLVHGYGLAGSGSNLWTRSVAEALAYDGEGVHLFCQETDPADLPFVSEARLWTADGSVETLFSRDTDYDGACVLHRPELERLPVFVRPPRGASDYLAYMPEFTDEETDEYLGRNTRALRRGVEEEELEALHVNHTVLMSEVGRRVSEATGVPFAVMPHGSAIEYVVRRDERFRDIAAGALTAAQRVLVLSNEIQDRLREVFPDVPGLTEKMRDTRSGVNTRQFELVARPERPASIERIAAAVAEEERGKTPDQTRRMHERLREIDGDAADEPAAERVQDALNEAGSYNERRPDTGLDAKLDGVDWTEAEIVTFVGRLISYKGIHSIVAALPLILRERPDVRVVLAGAGPLREVLEALVFALAEGRRDLARTLAEHGGTLEGENEGGLDTVTGLFDALEDEGKLADYFITAETHLQADPEGGGTVLFTGYLDHDALCHLFPCCDVAVFPSMVKEGAPLVVPEAMASGCYPMGTNFAGMKDSLDAVEERLREGGFTDEEVAPLRLRPAPEHTARDIAAGVPRALDLGGRQRETLRRVADERFSWRGIAESLTDELAALRSSSVGSATRA
jgi:glycosyltransferase involved in cell wall biosynthesis